MGTAYDLLRGIIVFSFMLLSGIFLNTGLVYAANMPSYPIDASQKQSWSFSGMFGTYDKAQLQRGLQVYTNSCASCHSLKYVSFRDLQALGYTIPQIREFAARFQFKTTDSQGSPVMRNGTPADFFPSPYVNDKQAALANNGVVPPDLSLIARARSVSHPFSFATDLLTSYNTAGADYIASLLLGYQDPPQNIDVPDGQYYNPYYISGATLSMPPILQDDLVPYNDGTVQSSQQYAKDVSAFLTWTADPHRDTRRKTGFLAITFLLVLAGLIYCLKREVWGKN